MEERGMGRMKMLKRAIVSLFIVFLFLCPLAYAEETSGTKNWEFDLIPMYLWMASMEGDMTVKGQTQSLELPFDEVFDSLEAVFTIHFEALYKKRWGFFLDYSLIGIKDSAVGPGRFQANIEVDFDTKMAELGVIFRFHEDGPHILEALGGARFTDLEAGIVITGNPIPPTQVISGQQKWWDPIIGLRYKWQMAKKWKLSLRGDFGLGFGAGDTSDTTWNAIGLIHFQPWKNVGFVGGYRALDVDYETGSGINQFKYDMLMHGPLLAITFHW
jgi:hypothetical protein